MVRLGSSLRIGAVVAGLGLLLSFGADAQERARTWRPRPRPVPAFSVRLEDGVGTPLRTFHGSGTTFVLGEEGERYVIVVANPTPRRVEAVVSVDGRDAVTGGVADFRVHRGYLVPAFGSVRIDGFRQSLDRVATFRFASPGDSYSSRMGTPENVGIIGVAFFDEREAPAVVRPEPPVAGATPPPRPLPRRGGAPEGRSKRTAPSQDRAEAPGDLGTEYGESRFSAVVEVPFVRAGSSPMRIVTLRYDDAEGLERRGFDVFDRDRFDQPRPLPREPQAFPDSRFAPPPP